VSPSPCLVEDKLHEILTDKHEIRVIHDNQILTKEEQIFPGWCRQQIIKLRSYRFCNSDFILCVGSDTIIKTTIELNDFFKNGNIVLHFREHIRQNKHMKYEINRCKNIASYFGTKTQLTHLYKDYVFDLFLFKAKHLADIESFFEKTKGGYINILPKKVDDYGDMVLFGEWTLYSMYNLHFNPFDYVLVNGNYLTAQIHSEMDVNLISEDYKSFHIVPKNINKNIILNFLE